MTIQTLYDWKEKHILVVEDDESSSYLISEILKDTGVHVDFSIDGEEAVNYIRSHPDTDLILMDLHLPEMDGFKATRMIKEIRENVVVIAQTACAFASDRKKAKEAGCDEFITKPLNSNLLLNKIDSYMQ